MNPPFHKSFWQRLPVRRLDRYLMRQFLMSYVICSCCILGLFVVLDGLTKLGRFISKSEVSAFVAFVRYFSATLPVYFSQYLGPVLTMMAAMFAVSLLHRTQEFIPMKVAGLSLYRILAPFFCMALLLALAQVIVTEIVLPTFKDGIREGITYGKKNDFIRPDLVIDNQNHFQIKVAEYYPHTQKGRGVKVHESYPETNGFKTIYQATEIIFDADKQTWKLMDGVFSSWDRDGKPEVVTSVNGVPSFDGSFHELMLSTSVKPIDFEATNQEISYLGYADLLDLYHRKSDLKHLEVKLHQRFAFPLANIILLLLGLPFVLRDQQRSPLVGVVIAIVIAAGYMLSTTVCADLGNRALLPAAIAAWLPVLFFGALGFTLFDGLDK
ncbi:MAG: LptF/LptG family permease [Planctomycetota bacterium]